MKRKRLPTRRRKALRRLLIAAALLFLLNRIFLLTLLFPMQAIRLNEEVLGTGRTEVVFRVWSKEVGWNHLTYLTGSEDITLLSGANLTLLGWMDSFGVPVDCSEDAPFYGGWWSINRSGKQNLLYVFGRIDDPSVARLEVQMRYHDWEDNAEVSRTAFSWSSERADWAEKDGRCYFLFRKYPLDWSDYTSMLYPVAIGYDEAGNEVARRELEPGASTHIM